MGPCGQAYIILPDLPILFLPLRSLACVLCYTKRKSSAPSSCTKAGGKRIGVTARRPASRGKRCPTFPLVLQSDRQSQDNRVIFSTCPRRPLLLRSSTLAATARASATDSIPVPANGAETVTRRTNNDLCRWRSLSLMPRYKAMAASLKYFCGNKHNLH